MFCAVCVFKNRQGDSFLAAKAVQNTHLGQATANDSLLICEGCFIATLSQYTVDAPCFKAVALCREIMMTAKKKHQLQLLTYLRMTAT